MLNSNVGSYKLHTGNTGKWSEKLAITEVDTTYHLNTGIMACILRQSLLEGFHTLAHMEISVIFKKLQRWLDTVPPVQHQKRCGGEGALKIFDHRTSASDLVYWQLKNNS